MMLSENDKEDASSVSIAPILSDDNYENEVTENEPTGKYTYRDYSRVTKDDDPGLVADNPPPTPSSRTSSESSIRVQKFPVKLYVILAQKEFQDIISWLPHGRSWKILKPALFESMVMPLFFEYSNYHSFNRLVNAWSFRRISGGPDRGSYYHELFLRGMPHLQKYMRRLPKTHKKLPMRKKDEPDFYLMNKTSPLPSLEDAPIPLVNTNLGGTMGGSGQYRDADTAQHTNQEQQYINGSMLSSPANFQTSTVLAAPQMNHQRYTSEDLYSSSQVHGAMHSGIGQLHVQPMMLSAAPAVQSSNFYGNPHLRTISLRQQPSQLAMAPSLMHQHQGMDAGYLVGGFESSPMGGTNYYQSYPTSTMTLLPSQGFEGTFASCPMMMQQHISDPIMMLQQKRAFIGIE